MQVTAEQLQQVSIFSKLDIVYLEQLERDAALQEYLSGEIIFHEGESLPAQLFAVLQGRIQVRKLSVAGKETLLRTLGAGEIFATAPALFGDGIAPATVIAEKTCQIIMVERDGLLRLMQQTPDVAFYMISVLNDRLQELHKTVHDLATERAIVRLARLVYRTAIKEGMLETFSSYGLKTHLSHAQIAASIGITYEECVRLFSQIRDIVKYQRGGQITILNSEKLVELSEK